MEVKTTSIQRALIVLSDFGHNVAEDGVNEFKQLVKSCGLHIVTSVRVLSHTPNVQYCIGKGKVAEITQLAEAHNVDLIIFNHPLTPAQERNLERRINVRVIDRISLILDIFAQRARSYEGKLQVELAQLKHLSTRLIKGWGHLERQRGGIGLRGPGETQLETDRRLIGHRIKFINQKLQKVRKQRFQSRTKRKRNNIPVISLVGYTNAGKSTLFNRLADSEVYVADQLFATLDPTLRRVKIKSGQLIILTDTVGFIRDLPHHLIDSFKATLDEIKEADLLIHIIDVDREQRQNRIDEVNSVIDLIAASNVPQIEVYNKIDRYPELTPRLDVSENYPHTRVWLSSLTGEGIDLLLEGIERELSQQVTSCCLSLPVTAGQLRAKLFELGVVKHECVNEGGGWRIEVEIRDFLLQKLYKTIKKDISKLQSKATHD